MLKHSRDCQFSCSNSTSSSASSSLLLLATSTSDIKSKEQKKTGEKRKRKRNGGTHKKLPNIQNQNKKRNVKTFSPETWLLLPNNNETENDDQKHELIIHSETLAYSSDLDSSTPSLNSPNSATSASSPASPTSPTSPLSPLSPSLSSDTPYSGRSEELDRSEPSRSDNSAKEELTHIDPSVQSPSIFFK